MKKQDALKLFIDPIVAVQKCMKEIGCDWMIIGGVAASIIGKPRFTADVDILILIDICDIANVIKIGKQKGISPRIKDAELFARKNRVLLLLHKASGINIDISLGLLPFEKEALARSTCRRIAGIRIKLPTAEDLIVFKAVAHRPQDMLDIREITEHNPSLDIRYIKKIVREFSSVLEMPEILDDVMAIISRS